MKIHAKISKLLDMIALNAIFKGSIIDATHAPTTTPTKEANQTMQRNSAFSLVELSIVLVILGLLTGGILAGQSLIRAAELRSIVSEYQRYAAATNSFRDKYMGYPGDVREATRFWNRLVNAAHCPTNTNPATAVGTPGACDGNGDGQIGTASGNSQSGEELQFWRQLALAGLIEGSYTGITGTAGEISSGTNLPSGKLSGTGWRIYQYTIIPGTAFNLTNYGAVMHGALNNTFNGVLRAEEMWNIDTKLDDGKPARGKVVVRPFAGCTSATLNSELDADYAVSGTSTNCTPLFTRFLE